MAPSNAHVIPACPCRPVVFDLASGHPACSSCGRPFMRRVSLADRECAARALRCITRSMREIAPVSDDARRGEIERSLLVAADLAARLKHGLPPPRRAP
jgi:hypothetical protein